MSGFIETIYAGGAMTLMFIAFFIGASLALTPFVLAFYLIDEWISMRKEARESED